MSEWMIEWMTEKMWVTLMCKQSPCIFVSLILPLPLSDKLFGTLNGNSVGRLLRVEMTKQKMEVYFSEEQK